MTIYSYFSLILFILFGYLLFKHLAVLRRTRLLEEPLKPEWIEALSTNVPIYQKLPANLQNKLHGSINLFLTDKEFVGCAGLAVTDEMKITIAGNACLLLLNNKTLNKKGLAFPGLKSILIYPEAYIAEEINYDGLVATQNNSARAGESWHRGPIVLSWHDVIKGSENPADGHNVVLHEFAHKLDEENGIVDGLPILREKAHYKEWAHVLTEEFASFTQRVNQGKNNIIDEYGAVSAPEFFAVATESFFEKPRQMKKQLPALYQQLQRFYGLDPNEWP